MMFDTQEFVFIFGNGIDMAIVLKKFFQYTINQKWYLKYRVGRYIKILYWNTGASSSLYRITQGSLLAMKSDFMLWFLPRTQVYVFIGRLKQSLIRTLAQLERSPNCQNLKLSSV